MNLDLSTCDLLTLQVALKMFRDSLVPELGDHYRNFVSELLAFIEQALAARQSRSEVSHEPGRVQPFLRCSPEAPTQTWAAADEEVIGPVCGEYSASTFRAPSRPLG